MKVLQINSVCGIGSTGRIATDIHNKLREQGHESYIAYGRELPKNCDNAIRIGTKIDNYIHVAKTRIFDKHGLGSKRATIEFIKKVKELNPDIIHLHNIHGYYINVEILFDYLKEANKPVVWTLHDCWSFTGHCVYFSYIKCEKWKKGCSECPQRKEYPKSLLFDKSISNYSKKKLMFKKNNFLNIVSVSKWLNDAVSESFLNENNRFIITNGIDTDLFKPKRSDIYSRIGIQNKFIILGVASKWTNRKGFRRFISLANLLSSDEVIVLVGVNKNQQKNLPSNIICVEKTNSIEDLISYYSEADVFVNMSFEETFGLVTAEAISCGTPAVVFNSTANPELINPNVGIVVEDYSEESVYKAIISIKNKDNTNADICHQHVKEHYSRKTMLNKYISLYNNLIYSNKNSR